MLDIFAAGQPCSPGVSAGVTVDPAGSKSPRRSVTHLCATFSPSRNADGNV